MLRSLIKLVPGIVAILLLATGLGLAFNFLSPNGLPLIRKPLRETRRFVTTSELIAQAPSHTTQASKPPIVMPKPEIAPPVKSQKPVLNDGQPSAPSTTPPKIAPPVTTQIEEREPLVEKTPEQPKKKVEALFTNLKDAKTLFDKKTAIFLDGRPIEDYDAEHIPGSLSLFCEKVDSLYKKVLANVPKDKIIVTYCSDPECSEAIDLADVLVAKGYTNVVILLEGLPGWKDAGYPTAKSKEPK
ncbi:MAG: rhodanese-like domain-containing protein [Armatimonadetes bacterium]|nr:rhodanese-like domain-containing protein [Armatimonadota bacterium]